MARSAHVQPGGIFEHMVEQASTGEVFEHHVQDVEPILKDNARRRHANAMGKKGFTDDPENDFKHVAQIPLILVEKWLLEEGINVYDDDHWPAVAAKLDSNEYKHLKTSDGTISKKPLRSTPMTWGRTVRKASNASDLVVVEN